MKGKIALITGGTSGIGRATAVGFAQAGATVVVCGRRQAQGEETIDLVRQAGSDGSFVQTDVSDEAAVQSLIGQTVERYGRLDYAFNNAGIGGDIGPLVACTRESWDQVISTNLTGVWLCMKYELQRMLQQGGGVIVNTASVAGVWGSPGMSAYVASKHAVVGLTKAAALEYAAAGVRVNVVAPAGILTDMVTNMMNEEMLTAFANSHPVGRLGQPEEVAQAVVWLCSDAASFITGHTLMIDGGTTAGVNPLG